MATTDQGQGNADQATRLRDAVLDAVGNAYGGALTIAGIHGFRYTGEVSPDNWPVPLEAALDTLIQYHRAASAVEALEAVGCLRPREGGDECGGACDACRALEAAQARLALLEQGRPAYEEQP